MRTERRSPFFWVEQGRAGLTHQEEIADSAMSATKPAGDDLLNVTPTGWLAASIPCLVDLDLGYVRLPRNLLVVS